MNLVGSNLVWQVFAFVYSFDVDRIECAYANSCYLFELAYDESLFLCRIVMRLREVLSSSKMDCLITLLHVWTNSTPFTWLLDSWNILPPESISP